MAKTRLAFTLPELLVVLAIIAILASVLFPVFRYAKNAAYRATCLSNYKQLHTATSLYVSDWDDRMMPVNHQPSAPANSSNDRTWVQLTLPYAKMFGIYTCPSDYGQKAAAETTFDQDLIAGDTYSKYYSASQRVNAGYNYAYLAPVYRTQNEWRSDPRSMSNVSEPSRTLMFVDSVWGRTASGTPYGGGSWLVVPPCRFEVKDGVIRDTFSVNGSEVFSPSEKNSVGWESDADSPFVYGSAWPWHQGKMTMVRTDGSVTSVPANALSAGCVVRENWQGWIRDTSTYIWDIN